MFDALSFNALAESKFSSLPVFDWLIIFLKTRLRTICINKRKKCIRIHQKILNFILSSNKF